MPAPLTDRFNRPLRDLRISVTDRCNFRCTYCMPRDVFGSDYPFLPRHQILSFEEIARLVGIFLGLGAEKVRLTGGEPLLRRELERLVEMIAPLDGLHDLTLTTNGALLAGKAVALRHAGLRRLTVSLDSLHPETFAAINDVDLPLERVLHGIDAAHAAGFSPIKINMVVKRGVNEHEVAAIAHRFRAPHFVVRFIEYMDVGNSNGWRLDQVVPAAEIIDRISGELPLDPLPASYFGEVARRFRHRDGGGEIGVISSVTAPFCADCTRARLSADGRLFTCLFASNGIDLRAPLRSGATDAELAATIGSIWASRDDRYSELRAAQSTGRCKPEMSFLGG